MSDAALEIDEFDSFTTILSLRLLTFVQIKFVSYSSKTSFAFFVQEVDWTVPFEEVYFCGSQDWRRGMDRLPK